MLKTAPFAFFLTFAFLCHATAIDVPKHRALATKAPPTAAELSAVESPDHYREANKPVRKEQFRTQRAYQAAKAKALPDAPKLENTRVVAASRGTLLQRSIVLSDGQCWTIVPRGSVLNVPRHYQDRVDGDRTGKLVSWSQFFSKNRGWLFTQPVGMEQARGEDPISESTQKAYAGTNRVVVAVFRNGPITVLEEALETAE